MTREELISVFDDTKNLVDGYQYSPYLDSHKLSLKRISDSDIPFSFSSAKVSVVNEDCIEVARKLSEKGKTCILNMASYKKPGGGVKNGAMAQEEELARRSNLMWGLPQEHYPLDINEFIYTEKVSFFKDAQYHIIPEFHCDVITIAAINLNALDAPKNYEQIMYQKIQNMLHVPYKYGCENLVLSAFGCGVFKNDPGFVSGIFKELIEDHSSSYNNICFAILNDRNSVGSNFEIFKTNLI